MVVPLASGHVKLNKRRAEDVSRIVERERQPWCDLGGRRQMNRRHQLHQTVDILFVVKLLKKPLALGPALLVNIFDVTPLQEAGVAQQNIAKINRLAAGEHASPEPMLHQLRKIAGMVDMGMGKDHEIDGLCINGEIAVLLEGLLAVALIKAAIEKNPLSTGFNKVHGTGCCTSGSKKCDFHILFLPVYDFVLVGNYTISIFFIRNGDNQWD